MAEFNKIMVGSNAYTFQDSSLANTLGASLKDNPEYLHLITDSEDKLLMGIKKDGSVEWSKGIPKPIRETINELDSSLITALNEQDSSIVAISDNIGELNDKMVFIDNDTDPHGEYISLNIDASQQLLEGITSDGIKRYFLPQTFYQDVEFKKSIKMSSDIQKSIKEMITNISDWSKEKHVRLPKPTVCAKVNIITEIMPTAKSGLGTAGVNCDIPAELEYWDKLGNYFKKPIILSAQGSSSLGYPVKNLSFDLDDKSEIKFGNWVAQDSFHLKVYYIDAFRGICNVGYNYVESVIQYTNSRSNRNHFKTGDVYNGTGNMFDDFRDPALCHPDGFPIEVYINGEYHDLMVWNIKKHRANYSMKKNDYQSILLDGVIGSGTFFNSNIIWSDFEIKNPKSLITMSGGKYDGEHPEEIMGSDSPYYNRFNKEHVNTNKTKQAIIRISNAIADIRTKSTTEEKREAFKSYFDLDACMIYYIIGNVLYHFDGYNKNWIWTIYDNKLAAPNFYDMDSLFGRNWQGSCVLKKSLTTILGTGYPLSTMWQYFSPEIKALYKELRDNKIISVDYIMKYVNDWVNYVGEDAYGRLFDKYEYDPENDKTACIPSYRDPLINTEYWETDYSLNPSLNEYHERTDLYNVGDEVKMPANYVAATQGLVFKCIKENGETSPNGVQHLFTGTYSNAPSTYLGMYDSPARISSWLTSRITYLDEYFEYTV